MSKLQSNVSVTLAIAEESTFGVAPTTGARLARRSESSLGLRRESFESTEARPDQQVYDMRLGMRKVDGSIKGELSLLTWDQLFEGLLRSTWATGVSKTQAHLGGITYASSAARFVFENSAADAGFRVGDVIRFTAGMPTSILNKNFRVIFLSADGKTVKTFPAPSETTSTPVATYAVQVNGKKLAVGTARKSYTIEQRYPDTDPDLSQLFTGCRVGSCAISIKPNGMVTVDWNILGQNGVWKSGSASPHFTSPEPAFKTGIFAGVNGSMRLGVASAEETEEAIVTSVDLTIDGGLKSEGVIGADVAPDVFYGPLKVTGSLSVYLTNLSIPNAFANEQDLSLVIQLTLPPTESGEIEDFFVIKLPRVKLKDATSSITADGGTIFTYPFQALLTPTDTLSRDEATIAFQRSTSTIDT